ncbi:MAG: HD-GYP domain-containing protein [Chloroflexota bacterium]|nr:HD-GYP domain-containing protein [Chloroflexota bacterium]
MSVPNETSPPTERSGPSPAARLVEWLQGRLPLDVTRFVAILTLAAVASLFLPHPVTWAGSSWVSAFVVLTVLSIGLEFVAVELPHGGVVSVATIGHIATILLVPPPFAAISVGSAVLIEELVQRTSVQRAVFNTSGHVLTISLASFAVGLIGDPRAIVEGQEQFELVVVVVAASLVYHVVNDILTSAVMALATGRPLVYLLRTSGRGTIFAEAAAGMIGVLFALIWIVAPLWTTLLAIPAAVIARALRYIRQLEAETRSAVATMAQVVDDRDSSTFHHSERVANYAVALAGELGLDQALIELIEQAASVHDLGKIGVPDRVLLKPGPLTTDERATMWLHTEIGARILSQFKLFRSGAEIVLHHHEAFDGSGYPAGLAGDAIPLGARVVAVADAFDAMTSDRPYRRALSVEEAVERFRLGAGRQWDPTVVAAMLRLLREGRLDHRIDHPQGRDHPHEAGPIPSPEQLAGQVVDHDDLTPGLVGPDSTKDAA